MSTESFVGLDVAKAKLAAAVRPSGERWSVANEEAGIAQLVERLLALHPALIVAEATGGFERAAIAALPTVPLSFRDGRVFASEDAAERVGAELRRLYPVRHRREGSQCSG